MQDDKDTFNDILDLELFLLGEHFKIRKNV